MAWYDSPVGVSFGNKYYDTKLHGSHDMTFLVKPNTPITQIAKGVISDISEPSWGKQVCVRLDSPIEGHEYFGILHLSAVNPSLKVGNLMQIGDLVGWSGGCNNEAQYAGTSNPTGQNFINPPDMSSQPQVGIALHDGPSYGGLGWKIFPPIDETLNPMPIVTSAQQTQVVPVVHKSGPDPYKMKQAYECWHFNDRSLMSLYGTLPAAQGPEYNLWLDAYMNNVCLGFPLVAGSWSNWGGEDGTAMWFQNGRIENIKGVCIAYDGFAQVYPPKNS